MKLRLLLPLLFFSTALFSQEICDNGIDDDGDGQIDLLDTDCQCSLGLNAQSYNAIPNPDFNNSSCCPDSAWWTNSPNSGLNCLDGWSSATNVWNNWWGAQYLNSCDTCALYNWWNNNVIPEECSTSVSNGFLGMTFWTNNSNWVNYNYASSCLNVPFTPGNTYTLQFDVFNSWWINNWNWDDTLRLSIYGTTNCSNIPMPSNSGCNDPNWVVLDSIRPILPFDSTWHTFNFNFQTNSNITGIAIGPSCDLTTNGLFNYHRIFLDNLELFESHTYDLQIAESGSYCNDPYLLTATIDTVGGTWQWYQDSVALVGETGSVLDITNYGVGDFTVLYSLGGNCQGLTISTEQPTYPFAFMNNVSDVCAQTPINFDGSSFIAGLGNSVTGFYWDFGDGTTANSEDTTYSYATSGTHLVQFVVESNLGCTDTVSQNVTIHPRPIVDFDVVGNCIYDSIQFTDLSTIASGVIDSISWDFDDGNFGLDSLESHLYNNYGGYTIELFAISDYGCVDSLTAQEFINPQPNASFTGLDTCAESTFSFVNSSTIPLGNIVQYTWDFDDNTGSGLQSPTHNYLNPNTYDVELIVESDSGCVDTSNLNIVSYPNPVADFDVNVSCFLANLTNQSTIASGTITNYDWDLGDTDVSTDISLEHIYDANGNYPVNLIVTSDFGCMDDTTIPAIINTNFAANITANTFSICHGECVELFDSSIAVSGVPSYEWIFGDGQSSNERNPVICFDNYTNINQYIDVFFKISTSTGCVDSIRLDNYLEVIPLPQAQFTYSPQDIPRNDATVQFQNQSTLATFYNWNFGDNTISEEEHPEHIYPDLAKSYSVSLTAYDLTEHCSDTYKTILVVEDELIFYIPNAFTPDGNAFNDNFSPVFFSGVDIYNFRLEIFNRWGELLFVSHDPGIGWDGYYGQNLVENGVYVWKVSFNETMSDKKHTKTGHVSVIR